MKSEIKKFLEFNGKTIFFLAKDGVYWIAIKPICEALGIDYETQRKNFKSDVFWNQLPSIQTVVAADNKARKMLCLSEQFIYGWIANIKTLNPSPELISYKNECCNILYNYFHGTITQRSKLLFENFDVSIRIADLEKSLMQNPAYVELQNLKTSRKNRLKLLMQLDQNLLEEGQLKIF